MSDHLNAHPGEYKPAENIKTVWDEFCAEIICACGDTVQFSDSSDIVHCDCGKIYRLTAYIEEAV